MNKKELRNRAKARRLAMTDDEVAAKSRGIAERFINTVELDQISNTLVYQAIPTLKEPDTGDIFSHLVTSGISAELAKSDKKTPAPRRKYDLIIVPCLAFDADCNRLGWGGGWYDRFLASQPRALKVGLAYQDSIIKTGLPAEPHDIALNLIVTEIGIIKP